MAEYVINYTAPVTAEIWLDEQDSTEITGPDEDGSYVSSVSVGDESLSDPISIHRWSRGDGGQYELIDIPLESDLGKRVLAVADNAEWPGWEFG